MKNGFIKFKTYKIPFIIDDYRMELFAADDSLSEFSKENNFKKDYLLEGECYNGGIAYQKITCWVGHSMGSTCYLRCYSLNISVENDNYDAIGLQSVFLDDIFRYKYNYIDCTREGVDFSLKPKEIYKIPFSMNEKQYKSSYKIGFNNHMGLLENFDKKGEILISLQEKNLKECLDIVTVFNRLAMFMTSKTDVPFKQITLYKKGLKVGWFLSPLVLETNKFGMDIMYNELDVMKYIPKILNNIALDPGNEIKNSIPLGHISSSESMFLPQRFMEQIMAFEYLFEKLENKKAKDKSFPLKEEIKYCIEMFPELLSHFNKSADEISKGIKETRRNIAHGYAYYYNFQNDYDRYGWMILLDDLIKKMSLKWIGFSNDEIKNYCIH